MTTKPTPYDAEEARCIVKRMIRLSPNGENAAKRVREEAALALLAEVQALFRAAPEFQLRTDEHGGVLVDLPRVGAFMLRGDSGRIRVVALHPMTQELAGDFVEVPLDFNHDTGRFEGRENDTRVVPEPGKRIPKRSALAVIVEAAESFLKPRSA